MAGWRQVAEGGLPTTERALVRIICCGIDVRGEKKGAGGGGWAFF